MRRISAVVATLMVVAITLIGASAVLAHGVIDQSYSPPGSFIGSKTLFPGAINGQQFTPTKSSLNGVDVYLRRGTPGGDNTITMYIKKGWWNTPVLATSQMTVLANQAGRIHFDISPPLGITPGQKYFIQLTVTTYTHMWKYNHGSYQGYPGGQPVGLYHTRDFFFRTYYPNPNTPPELDPIGNMSVDEGQLLTFTITATDPENDPLTYSADNLPVGASFDPENQTFSWIPGYDQAGTYDSVKFQVSDGSLTDYEEINITVNNGVLQATVDIDPDTVKLGAKGRWITAYIEPPSGYQPTLIDLDTVKLNDIVQAETDPKYDFVTDPSSYTTDKDEDGILERMVKFDAASVQSLLNLGDNTLVVTGRLLGWPSAPDFEGSDTLRAK